MAQLRDLIVNGASRFLGVVMFNNETHFNNISNFHSNVNFNNNILLSSSSTLNLLNTTAAAVATYNSPALVIGPSSGIHLEIDSSQIIAKASTNTISSLYLNASGGQVVIGPGGLSSSGIIVITNKDVADKNGQGALQIAGGIYASLNSYFADTIEVDGGIKAYDTSTMQNINPETKETYNLGTTNNRWLCLYSKNLNISDTSAFGGKITANAGINITSGGLDIDAGGIILDADDLTITAGKINASNDNVTHTIAGKVQITQGDAASATANTGTLQVTGGIRATAGSYFASTVGIDGALNVNNTGIFSGNIFVGTESATNPYYKLTDSNKNVWYFQALNNKCYIGPTSANALNIDVDGNIAAVGSISIGRKANTTMGQVSVAIGGDVTASGKYSHAEGLYTIASEVESHAEGYNTLASGSYSHAEGYCAIAAGNASHAEGSGTIASGGQSHAEGNTAIAYGPSSHAEGHGVGMTVTITGDANATTYTLASPNNKIKVGQVIQYESIYARITAYDSLIPSITVNTTLSTTTLSSVTTTIYRLVASGESSHAEGYSTLASGAYSHAEGYYTTASGGRSHAEGYYTTASGAYSHAEGYYTTASGSRSHADGCYTLASGSYSHAEGYYTTANSKSQHVQGEYNILDTTNATARSTYAHIVGNGTGSSARSNAHTLDWSGNAWFAGDVYVRSTSGTNKDTGSKKLATESFVINNYLPLTGGTVTGITKFSNSTDSTSTTTGAVQITGGLGVAKNIRGNKVYGAVWNDYAEYRQTHHKVRAGQCVYEKGDGSLAISYERMMPGANIVSDTFGFAIGETKKCKTPLAVSGRVLAYPYEPKEEYKAGDAVCSGPNGTISKMTRAEIRDYPERIIGIVSEIPTYEVWGSGNVKVNGRIWIKVR